jgi:hypothetical protein
MEMSSRGFLKTVSACRHQERQASAKAHRQNGQPQCASVHCRVASRQSVYEHAKLIIVKMRFRQSKQNQTQARPQSQLRNFLELPAARSGDDSVREEKFSSE